MKLGMCSLLLLLASCAEPEVAYDYELTWTCLSSEGCERTEDVERVDRLNVNGEHLTFHSTWDENFYESAQRLPSDSSPAGCFSLYAFSLFGYELDPVTMCPIAEGFELRFDVPNVNPATYSEWKVTARDLGPW